MDYNELNTAADEGKNLTEAQIESVITPPIITESVTTPPIITESVTTPPIITESVDNTERSQLGRKVKELTETVTTLQQIIIDNINNNKSADTSNELELSSNDDDFTIPTTYNEFKSVIDKLKYDENKSQEIYSNSYLNQVAILGTNEPMHKEVVDEMMNNFNIKRSENGNNDAMINYYQAKSSILAKKMAAPIPRENPFHGTHSAPTGVGGGGVPPVTSMSMPTLDPDSERYVNYLMKTTGKNKEDIVKSLGNVLK